MKKTYLLLTLTTGLLASGCVSTTYEKAVTVTKDADGKIIQRVETERVVQPNQSGWPVHFEHLKGVVPGEKKQ